MPENTQGYYTIEWLYYDPLTGNENAKDILAQVPFQMGLNENTRLRYAYEIAELLAHKLFMSSFVQREIKGQLCPVYFADKLTGQTISVR